ncbi:hypothetical protein CsmBV2.2 [Diolcogaster facetosa bracovirus]|uniref:Uncharacterized protein n=1 Tax=Bracoviriform facetosae TaxID=2083300 RepID=R9XJH7_9VIRU|nr:hypothetical protein CsmBV2.2 [Diolcogaster facetosa bracovirus] [Bracoviriform facetosae]AGO14494.1 hypothetical protein CsmBV2.2 [Diolcogaster facetosa bracovirus] [Bracoviriform facetosae]
MFNNKLIALLLITTIDIPRAESAHSRDLWLKRHRRAIDEQSKWVNFGSLNRHYENNYYLNQKPEGGDGSQNPSVIIGSITNQDSNSYTSVDHATNVYVVLPYWYNVSNQQTPSAVHRSLGTRISQQRYHVVNNKIEQFKQTLAVIQSRVRQIESRTYRDLDRMFEKSTDEDLNMSSKLNTLFHKCDSLKARLDYQKLRLRHFNDDTLPMHDIFDGDLAHLKTILETANLELISLQAG